MHLQVRFARWLNAPIDRDAPPRRKSREQLHALQLHKARGGSASGGRGKGGGRAGGAAGRPTSPTGRATADEVDRVAEYASRFLRQSQSHSLTDRMLIACRASRSPPEPPHTMLRSQCIQRTVQH